MKSELKKPSVDLSKLHRYRFNRLIEQMQLADVDLLVLVNPVSLRYASDYRNYALFQSHIPTFYLFVTLSGDLILYGGYAPTENIADVREAKFLSVFDGGLDLRENGRGFAEQVQQVLNEANLKSKRIACERLNPSAHAALNELGYEILDAEPIVEKARYIKSSEELTCMKYAIEVAQQAMMEIKTALKPGMTENQLWSILHQVNTAHDGDWIDGRMLSSGTRTNPWLQESSDKIIAPGELVGLDTDMIGPFGYCADISRTFLCPGKSSNAKQRDCYQRALTEIENNIQLLKPGLSYRELSQQAYQQEAQFIKRRYPCLAHGVGMSDEYPKVYYRQDWDKHGYDGIIEANTVMSIESYVGSEYGGEGVKLEEMVLITDDKVERLSSFEFESALY